MGHRLLSAALRCRQCSRSAGELAGYADRSLGEPRFVPLGTHHMPRNLAGHLSIGLRLWMVLDAWGDSQPCRLGPTQSESVAEWSSLALTPTGSRCTTPSIPRPSMLPELSRSTSRFACTAAKSSRTAPM